MTEFSPYDYWKGIVLYGLNAATYKMALVKCLLEFAQTGQNQVQWEELATSFYDEYRLRISNNSAPQQATPGRLTVLERIVNEEAQGRINRTQAIEQVGSRGFNDVIPRFQTIGKDANIARGVFYEFDFGRTLNLKDNLLKLGESSFKELNNEVEARWCLLEGSFSITHSQNEYKLANDIR